MEKHRLRSRVTTIPENAQNPRSGKPALVAYADRVLWRAVAKVMPHIREAAENGDCQAARTDASVASRLGQ